MTGFNEITKAAEDAIRYANEDDQPNADAARRHLAALLKPELVLRLIKQLNTPPIYQASPYAGTIPMDLGGGRVRDFMVTAIEYQHSNDMARIQLQDVESIERERRVY